MTSLATQSVAVRRATVTMSIRTPRATHILGPRCGKSKSQALEDAATATNARAPGSSPGKGACPLFPCIYARAHDASGPGGCAAHFLHRPGARRRQLPELD